MKADLWLLSGDEQCCSILQRSELVHPMLPTITAVKLHALPANRPRVRERACRLFQTIDKLIRRWRRSPSETGV
jgi:hypothetical protein